MGRVSLKFEGDASGARRAIREIGREIEGTAESANTAFSTESLSDYVIGLGVVGQAIGGLTAAFREFGEISEQALARLEGARASGGALAQLAGSEAEYEQLKGAAADFSRVGGVDIDAAQRSVFSISSAGFGPDTARTFAVAQSQLDLDAASTARSLATLRGTLGSSGLGLEGDLSQLIAASSISPSGAGEIAEGASRSGALAARLGIGREELLSAEAVLANATGSPERGATQLQALLKSAVAEEDRFKGLGLGGILQEISRGGVGETAGDTSGPALQKGFGRAEGFLGFAALQTNQFQFQRTVDAVRAAGSGQAFRDKLSFIGADQTAAAVAEFQSSEQELAQAQEGFGEFQARGVSAINRRQAERFRAGSPSAIAIQAATKVASAVGLEGVSGAIGADVPAAAAAEAITQGVTTALLGRMVSLLEDIAGTNRETSKKAGGVVGQAVPGADE